MGWGGGGVSGEGVVDVPGDGECACLVRGKVGVSGEVSVTVDGRSGCV